MLLHRKDYLRWLTNSCFHMSYNKFSFQFIICKKKITFHNNFEEGSRTAGRTGGRQDTEFRIKAVQDVCKKDGGVVHCIHCQDICRTGCVQIRRDAGKNVFILNSQIKFQLEFRIPCLLGCMPRTSFYRLFRISSLLAAWIKS